MLCYEYCSLRFRQVLHLNLTAYCVKDTNLNDFSVIIACFCNQNFKVINAVEYAELRYNSREAWATGCCRNACIILVAW